MKAALILVVLSLPANAETISITEMQHPRPVVSVIVHPQATLPVSYVGTVTARIEADLGFPLAGTIAERPVSAGDLVDEGEVLARLDPQELDAGLRAAEAGVAVATAELRSAADARERAGELAARGVGSETRVEDTERALIAAEAGLAQARATFTRARDMLDLATLTAPQSGVVTEVFAEAGTALAAGQPVLRLAASGEREVVIDLSERDVATVEPGTAFTVELVANPAITTSAKLTRIDPVAERTTRTRRLHLTLDPSPEAFRLGALARVSPSTGPDAGVILPRSAIIDPDGDPRVWIIDRSDDSVQRVAVQLGLTITDHVVITSGIASGDEVVVKGIHSLEDGQKVGPRVAE